MPGVYNCDWFSFTADFSNYDPEKNQQLRLLFENLDREREKPENDGFIDLGLFSFQVFNHGSRSYYYILHNEDLQLKLARFRPSNKETFPVYVHFKSQFLWSEFYGLSSLLDKFRLVIGWLQDLLGGDYIQSKINRIDLAYHTDDVPEDISAEYFVGKHTLDTTRRTHRVVTGIDIGSRKTQKIFLRVYNKYLEARGTKKTWFFDLWIKAGLNVRKVWNVEFEIHRDFLRETKINGKLLDSAEDVIQNQNHIWYYLTTQWVSYRIPDNPRRSRWSIHDWWLSLLDYAEGAKITRLKQIELPTLEAIMPGLTGYLSSFAVRVGGDLEDGTIFRGLYEHIVKYERSYEKKFAELVEKKKRLLGL